MSLIMAHPDEPQALYRFFDATGVLLYVGVTNDPGRRWSDHRRRKDWWHEVTSVTVERYATRGEVLAAELQAIHTEEPRYNIQGMRPCEPEDELTDALWDDERFGSVASAHLFSNSLILMAHQHAIVDGNPAIYPRRLAQRIWAHSNTRGVPVYVDVRTKNRISQVWFKGFFHVEFKPFGSHQVRGKAMGLKVAPTQSLLDDLQQEFDDMAEETSAVAILREPA